MRSLNKKVLLIAFVILALLLAGVSLYFWKFRKSGGTNTPQPIGYSQSETMRKLNSNSAYLESEDLKLIRPDELVEYFRQGIISFKYSADPKREFGLEIEKKIPGEAGRVIREIFLAYCEYDSYLSDLNKNESLDDYEKWNEKIKSRDIFFGRELREKLFPKRDSETIEKYFLYTKRYLKKHESDDFRSKKIHLEKAKAEIYGLDYHRLLQLEPVERQFELELNLRKKQIEIMSEKEKEVIKKEILESIGK